MSEAEQIALYDTAVKVLQKRASERIVIEDAKLGRKIEMESAVYNLGEVCSYGLTAWESFFPKEKDNEKLPPVCP